MKETIGKINRNLDFILERLISRWILVEDFYLKLVNCRWSVGIVLVGGFFILSNDQGREIATRTPLYLSNMFFALLGTWLWAIHSWLSARLILDRIYPAQSVNRDDNIIKELPRYIGLSAFLITFIAFSLVLYKDFNFSTLILIIINIAFGRWFYHLLDIRTQKDFKNWNKDNDSFLKWLTPLTVFYSVGFLFWSIISPVSMGFFLGSVGVIYFGLSSIVATGTWLSLRGIDILKEIKASDYYTSNLKSFPIITFLVVFALIFSALNLSDNHKIRGLDTKITSVKLSDFIDVWYENNLKINNTANVNNPMPLVIVATAGGGIRAAYWTAAVLSELTDTIPNFQQSLFAISGVSGGSVGAVFYNEALRSKGKECRENKLHDSNCLKKMLAKSLSADFLAPTMAGFFYTDLLQRFIPYPILPDRANALEESFKESWKKHIDINGMGLETPLSTASGINKNNDWQPALLLNSTHVETGKRVIASSISLDSQYFIDAVDLLKLLDKDMTVAEAAVNSARFTYVSPPGTLPENYGHTVDGGYFENFGAITAAQLLDAIRASNLSKKIKPIIIVISNDENLTKIQPGAVENNDVLPFLQAVNWGNEILAPFRALFDVRDAHAILPVKKSFADLGNNFFHFRLDLDTDPNPNLNNRKNAPALGWSLSESSERMMDSLIHNKMHNETELQRLKLALSADSSGKKYSETGHN